jgi:peptidyl-prolyl cis-trans isomerase B (cyclophilin B)
MKLNNFWKPLVMLSVAAGAPGALAADPQVDLKTNHGTIRLELYPAKAPKTVENFLQYVKDGHFNGTIFHRVIDGFMIQGGGFDKSYKQKATRPPIENEAKNGLKNDLGTIAMARTSAPHSASSQFFINGKNNDFLNAASAQDGWGYTVFGKVVSGMDVVMKISKSPTGPGGPFPTDAPREMVVIESATLVADKK